MSGENHRFVLVDGALESLVRLPEGAHARAADPPDVSVAPGVTLALHRKVEWPEGALHVACVQASADRWVHGLEDAVLAGASALVRKHLGLAVVRALPGEQVGQHVEQSFEGSDGGTGTPIVHGRHLLGFTPEPSSAVVLCSAACVPSGPGGDVAQCQDVVESFEVRGFVPALEPGVVARAVALAVGHPQATVASVGVAVLLAVAVLLRYRPRPRW